MEKKDCFYLGKIVRKYSFRGQVVIKLDTDEPELYQKTKLVFLDIKNKLIPYEIKKSLLQKGNQLRVLFEGVDTEEGAVALLKSDVYLPLSELPVLTGNNFYFHEIIGFEVIDVNYGSVGAVTGVNDSTAQALFEIKNGDRQVLIPVIDDFIKEVNREDKKIVVEAPDGLIAMYLE
ncbi:ribosome maturation factor RimM [Flavobacteriaceae bacterium F08102]|nr:ribosome maturation factor RimM [Flavobacteriaceae bacterium F08102]